MVVTGEHRLMDLKLIKHLNSIFPSLSHYRVPNSSQRELRVKVWQQEEPISSPGLLRQDSDIALDRGLDNLPTSPLIASSSHSPAPRNATSAPSHIGT